MIEADKFPAAEAQRNGDMDNIQAARPTNWGIHSRKPLSFKHDWKPIYRLPTGKYPDISLDVHPNNDNLRRSELTLENFPCKAIAQLQSMERR